MIDHDLPALGAHVLGVLELDAARAVDRHLDVCGACRAELADLVVAGDALATVPPEFFLDGPPDGGDMLLQRTLRAVRADQPGTLRSQPRRSLGTFVAAGAILVALGAAGGTVVGREIAPTVAAAPGVSNASPQASVARPGARVVTGDNPTTGASMTAALTPASGWVRIHVKVSGVVAMTRCQLVIAKKDGRSVMAGSWLVSETGEEQGTNVDGSALVSPSDVAAVTVLSFDGATLVTAVL